MSESCRAATFMSGTEFAPKSFQWVGAKTLPRIVKKRDLAVYKHKGFWQCMDTPRDKIKILEEIKNGKIKF